MPRFRTSLLTAGAGLAAVALTGLAAASTAAAAPASSLSTTSSAVPAAAGWLTTQFAGRNHLPSPTGDHFDSKYGSDYYPSYGENADVIFGLAAAKAGGTKIATALDYLAANADAYADFSQSQGGPYDGSVAKLAVADIVAGGTATSFGGHNLLQTLKTDECTSGSCTVGSAANIYSSVSESFVIIAESRGGSTYAPSTAAINYFLSLQCSSGGFTGLTAACSTGSADVDSTSYAIMALEALGGHTTQLDSAVGWLQSQRNSGGYWVSQGTANTNSTGLAAAALQGAGEDVSASRTWLRSQQVPRGQAGAGALKFAGTVSATTTAATSPSVLATAQGLVGLVDDGGLATLTAAGATSDAAVFAPTTAVSKHSSRPGAKITVTSHGFAAGETVKISIHSTPVVVASPKADALGSVRATFTLPSTVPAGAHTIELVGQTSGLVTTNALTVASTSSPAMPTPVATTGASSRLAATGQDGRQLLELAVLGALATIAGLGLSFAGRARRHS